MNTKKISFITLGCSKNTVDSQVMMSIAEKGGYEVTEDLNLAHYIVVNTCSFINDAKQESIDAIIELGELKNNTNKKIIVTGCLAQRYHKLLLDEMPEIDAILGTGDIDAVLEIIEQLDGECKPIKIDGVHNDYCENTDRTPYIDSHVAYVKIAEGCDNRCSYCIIPKLRGKLRSRKIEDIVAEISSLVKSGVKEVILIAQDTSRYGLDLYKELALPRLLDELNKIEDLKWVRILYLYPDCFTDELINAIKRNDKVVNYVDIPTQHISDKILKRMNRHTNSKDIKTLINKLRSNIPDIQIRTTLLVGFPGETDQDFDMLKDFVKEAKFDRLGAFSYSHEEDTPSYKLDGQVEEEIKINRRNEIMETQLKISLENNEKKVDNVYEVIIDEIVEEENLYIGRTYMDAPDVDGVVFFNSEKPYKVGEMIQIRITEYMEYDLKGVVEDEFTK